MIRKCSKCKENKNDEEFYHNKGKTTYCKECQKNSVRQYYTTEKGKLHIRRKSKIQIEKRHKLKEQIINHYSGGKNCCECCGEKQKLFLTVDHINNDGYENRMSGFKLTRWLIKNNFPIGFQVLCMNCNLGKHLNHGICPHRDGC